MKNIFQILLLTLSILSPSFSQKFPLEFRENDMHIVLSLTDSVDFPDYYSDQSIRDSISKTFDNAHRLAKAIEQYSLKKYNPGIKIKDSEIIITLQNNNDITIAPIKNTEEADYNFEYYFSDLNLLLFRVQWYEGNDYFILNKKNGKKTYMLGLPYFSPSKKYLIEYTAYFLLYKLYVGSFPRTIL